MIALLLYFLCAVVVLYLLLATSVCIVQAFVPVKWKAVLNAISLILVFVMAIGVIAAGYVHFRTVL